MLNKKANLINIGFFISALVVGVGFEPTIFMG